jgi:hypothetical protein
MSDTIRNPDLLDGGDHPQDKRPGDTEGPTSAALVRVAAAVDVRGRVAAPRASSLGLGRSGAVKLVKV